MTVDLDYIEDTVPRERASEKAEIRSISLPEGSRWGDLSITVADASLLIRIRGYEKELSLEDAGFGDRRHSEAEDDQVLETLQLFAAGRGRLSAERVAGRLREKTSLKHRVSNLRRHLQVVLGIDGDPISFKRAVGEYWCSFELRLAGHESFPTPAGASWLDFHFTERSDGRLAVSITEKQVFRASDGVPGTCRPSSAAAERNEPVERLYSFDELGLRNAGGQLTPEGHTLIRFIQAGGKVNRRGDDLGALNLAAWLRKWTGLTDHPLQYSERTGTWSTRFQCGPARAK